MTHSVGRLLGVALLLSLSLGATEAPRPNVILIIWACLEKTDTNSGGFDGV